MSFGAFPRPVSSFSTAARFRAILSISCAHPGHQLSIRSPEDLLQATVLRGLIPELLYGRSAMSTHACSSHLLQQRRLHLNDVALGHGVTVGGLLRPRLSQNILALAMLAGTADHYPIAQSVHRLQRGLSSATTRSRWDEAQQARTIAAT